MNIGRINKVWKDSQYNLSHDLHNQGGALSDGIAEAFIDWAKKEKLSFWK